ncbi:disintegrin and metalloproteinase domain-containing protein 28-like [Rattus norvegicus]|uniref:disintegrin and metalloproteinase domain-containing protein 28-like n=1 Tax=Rattus norvegicus TaxID=10116 RepID=UPI0003D08D65|nr:disintegrin and metalloproteinase domain-containing protein 28-like isoform X1 [Rattus norvegicus]|eukprot:XP_008769029.1 PREDICTED: disintegrin and metalloproteinase domain-containing protein 28-like [Rattus norvegicus]
MPLESFEPKKPGVVCRAEKDECDLPEMCDGEVLQEGEVKEAVGYIVSQIRKQKKMKPRMSPAFSFLCSLGLQLMDDAIQTQETKVANKSCYKQNEGGSKYGYCHVENGTHMPCKAKCALMQSVWTWRRHTSQPTAPPSAKATQLLNRGWCVLPHGSHICGDCYSDLSPKCQKKTKESSEATTHQGCQATQAEV